MQINTNPIGYFLAAALGGIVTFVVEKYKNRQALLKLRKYFNPLASTILNDHWGNIEVFYNGREARHLNFISVQIDNTSNVDIKALEIDFWSDPQSQILVSTGAFENGKEIKAPADFDKRFSAAIAKAVEERQLIENDPDYVRPGDVDSEIKWALKNRSFLIPAFNRKSTIKFSFLVENWDGKTPLLFHGIAHPGVNLQEDFGIPENNIAINKWVIWIGWALYSIGLTILYYSFSSPPFAWYDTLIGLLGLIYYPLAYYFIKIAKEIRDYFN